MNGHIEGRYRPDWSALSGSWLKQVAKITGISGGDGNDKK